MTKRPLDEVYETIRDVEQDPIGALMAVQQLVAEVARLRAAADDMAELLAQTVTMHASGFWLRDRDAALAAYRAALAHGEAHR
jgi:hypothetical protein